MSPRLARAALAALCSIVAALAVASAPASALPQNCSDPSTPGCEPVSWTDTATRKLTVSRSAGTVTGGGIDCGSVCTSSRTVTRECVDAMCGSWDAPSTWTLSASGGPAGHVASWSDCGVQPTCTVSLGDEGEGAVLHTTTLSWIDNAAPSVTFAPPAKVGPSNYNVSAAGSDTSGSIARYAWTVDGVTQAATGAVLSLSGASHGTHTVTVRSFDGANNGSTVVSKNVAVDKAVGVTPTAPPAITNAATVPFSFTADADVVSRQCSLDGGGYAACTSGWSGITAATADGTHTYRVKVADDVGNVAESALQTVVVDRTQPVLAFTDGPTEGQQVVTRNASITFSLTEPHPAAVKCKPDAGAWATCTPGAPVELAGLTDGPHVLSVQATDTAGNTRTINRSFGVQIPVTGGGETPAGGGEEPADGGTTTTVGGTTTTGGTSTGGTSTGGTSTGGTSTGGGTTPPAAKRAFAPRFTHNYVYLGKVTTFTSLAISSLPRTAKVTVACKGSGCAGKSKTLKHSGGKLNVLKALKKLKLKAGATLVVTVRGEGGARAIAKFTIRNGQRPGVSYRCAKSGGKLGACS